MEKCNIQIGLRLNHSQHIEEYFVVVSLGDYHITCNAYCKKTDKYCYVMPIPFNELEKYCEPLFYISSSQVEALLYLLDEHHVDNIVERDILKKDKIKDIAKLEAMSIDNTSFVKQSNRIKVEYCQYFKGEKQCQEKSIFYEVDEYFNLLKTYKKYIK